MTVKSGKVVVLAAVLSELDIDLTTVDLTLGVWATDVDPNGLLNLLEKNASSICFDSVYQNAIPLQDEASMKSENGDEYSGGDKSDIINVELMAQNLDSNDADMIALRTKVVALAGKSKIAYVFDPVSGVVRKLKAVKFNRIFDVTGGKKEVWTISGTWSGTIADDFQIKKLTTPEEA